MITDLCFFAINKSLGIHYADGGINNKGHNGYVRDCTSLGPDVVPGARDVPQRVMPKAALKMVKGKGGKAILKVAPPTPTSFYDTIQ